MQAARRSVVSHPLEFTSVIESSDDESEVVENAKFMTIKEIIPNLDDAIIWEILKGNKYDVEKSLDAALALSTSLNNEQGSTILKTTSNDAAHHSSENMRRTYSASSVKPPMERVSSLSVDTKKLAENFNDLSIPSGHVVKYAHVDNRGTVLILPNKFLSPPRYRMIVTHECEFYKEFSIAFRRKNEKLGVTIQEVNNCEMSIVNLHYKDLEKTEPLLAMQAGVQIGDILLGINNEYFTPVVDVEDVLDILRLSGNFVTLHFKRKYKLQPKDISEFHKGIRYLLDNNVIVQEQVRPVDHVICRLKERTLNWNDSAITERIDVWKLDPLLYKKVPTAPSAGSLFFDRFAGVMSIQNSRNRANSTAAQLNMQKPINSRRSVSGVDMLLLKLHQRDLSHSGGAFIAPLNRRNSTGSSITAADGSSSSEHDHSYSKSRTVSKDDNGVKSRTGSRDLTPPLLSPVVQGKSPMHHHSSSSSGNGNNSNSSNGNRLSVNTGINSPMPYSPKGSGGPPVSLRPAISFRILHAEDQAFDYIAYVIWITDVVSGVEWIIRRRYKEFFELREQIIAIRPAVEKLEFPPKGFAVSESTIIVEERLKGLQRFLYRILCLTTINSLHPSTVRIALLLQRFFMVDEHQELINAACEQVSPELRCTQMVQVFIHNIIHMQVMDKVVVRFLDNFLEHEASDVARDWNERDADKVVVELRNFLEHLQNFLADAFYDDCKEIVLKYNSKNSNGLLTPIAAAFTKLNPRLSAEDTRAMQEVLIMLSEDEQRLLIRGAIRRQVEIEVYVPCSARINFLLNRSFYKQENALRLKIAHHILHKPQSYFGIPQEHQSPSKWGCLVTELREIRGKTLPSDRIDWIIQVAKEIPKLYQLEHPDVEKPLGADEMLPIFIYILVMAEIPDLISLDHELQALCDPDKRLSETGYYLATFEASLQHVVEADVNDFSEKLFSSMAEEDEEEGFETDAAENVTLGSTSAADFTPRSAVADASPRSQRSQSTGGDPASVKSQQQVVVDNIQRAKDMHEENEKKFKESFKKARTVRKILEKI